MTALAAVGAWVLALIFLWSGATKLRRPRLAAMAMVDFGVVRRPVTGLGLALGLVEVGLGLVLLTGLLAGPALGVATLLLGLFTVLLARSLAAGAEFPCQCFGGEDDAISARTLARTGGLTLGAALLWLGSGVSEPGYRGLADLPLRAVAALGVVGIAVLAGRLPGILGWNREILGTFRILADADADTDADADAEADGPVGAAGGPQPGGRTALPLQEVTRP